MKPEDLERANELTVTIGHLNAAVDLLMHDFTKIVALPNTGKIPGEGVDLGAIREGLREGILDAVIKDRDRATKELDKL